MTPPTSGAGEARRRRLHVLHVSAVPSGGLADVVTGYVRDQVERGWSVAVATPSDGPLGFEAREAGATVRWWSAAATPGLANPAETLRLRRIVAELRPDVVHLHGLRAGTAGRLVVHRRVPTLHQPHGWSWPARRGPRRLARMQWERFATRWTDELVCGTERERLVGDAGGVVAPALVLRHGVDVSRLRPQEDRDRRAARADLGLDDTAPTAVCVLEEAVLEHAPGVVRAWSAVRERVPGARLLLVGVTGVRAPEEVEAGVAGVSFVGDRADVPTWLGAADVVVTPAATRGVSLLPLQAMASARSVVATEADPGSLELPDDGGEVVPIGDDRALADAVVRRLESPELAEDEGWNGRSHVEFHHDSATSARELSRVYLRLVAVRRDR